LQQQRVEFRLARPSEVGAVSAVLRQSFAELEPQYTSEAFAATVISDEEATSRMSEGPVWVGLVDGHVVATGSAVVRATGLYIRGMGVVPQARGLRLGWRLLELMEDFARHRGLQRMYLSTTPFLDRAIRLYESYGFERTDEPPHEMFGTPLFTMSRGLTGAGENIEGAAA